MKAFDVDGVLAHARDLVAGVLVDPELPRDFDDLANEQRPPEQVFWWFRPYVVSYRDASPEFIAHFPEGVRFDVRCLDGGAWDRSTWWGSFSDLRSAVACATQPNPHGVELPTRWPGRRISVDTAN